jgi:TonB-dependent receptor
MFVVFPNSGQVRPRGIYHMRIYKTGLLAAAAVAVLTSAAAPAQAWQAASSAEARAAINIPAQDLGRAIQTLSRQTGLQIVFDPELTRGLRAQAVSGSMTPREALRRMIAGSGVEAREVRGVLTLVRQTAEASMPTTDATVLEEVLVVGYAAGMRRSLDAKRDADFISDVISADDMGDLPANNVAESLSRLPGVNAVRNHTTGEGDRITIRGLSTELNNYTMNGVRIGGTGSPDDSFYRGVRLSFLPPEGIDSITVVKSLTPDRDGDALGGSIDIRTPTAFDHKPTYGVLSASAGLLDKFDDKTSGEVSGSFGRQFNDHWGVFVTASWSRRKSQFEQNGVDGDNQPPVWYEDSESLGWETDTFVLRGMDLAFGETEVERKGLNASLDYRGDHHDFHFRGQFNEYTQDEFDNRLNFRNDTSKNSTRLTQVDKTATGLANPDDAIIGSGTKGNIYSYTTAQIVDRDGDGVITDADRSTRSYYTLNGASGTWDPQGFRLRRFWEGSRETGSLMSLNLGGVSRYGDFKLDYDLSYAKSEDNIDDSYDMEFRSDKYGWLGNKGVDIVNFGDSRFPKWVLNDAGMAAVQDPAQYKYAGLSGEVGGAQEDLWQGQFNAEWRPVSPWLDSVKGGAKFYSSKRATYSGEFLDLDAEGTLADFSAFYGKEVTDLFDGEYTGLYRLGVIIDNQAMLAELQRAMNGDSSFFEGFATDPSSAKVSGEDSFEFKEDILAGYLMATARFGDAQIIGGLRVESTRNDISAYVLDEVQGERFTTDKSDFVNVLPSIHLNYALNRNTKVRAAIWTSFARPDIARMTSAREYSYDIDPDGDGEENPTSDWVLIGIEQGNPDLKPMKAINYDLSIERYNGDTGAYSLGLFYKDIENFLFRSASSNIRDGTAGANIGPDGVTISMPNNGKWAEVYGVEMSAQQIFYWLPGALSGLGASVNLTLQHSEAETGISWHPAGYTLPLMETPEAIANVQLFWQYSGWEAYAAYSYQSEFLEGIQDFGNNPYEQDYEFVDLNVRRKLWGGATASLQVQNLFDNHTYWYTAGSSTGSSRAYIKNGRSISLGLTYVF